MIATLTEDTKTVLLLCGVLGKSISEKPLSQSEYTSLVQWLIKAKLRPADLLKASHIHEASIGSGINEERLEKLLNRGVQLGFAIEEWQNSGVWVISRSDSSYPIRYRQHLKDHAPALLFGVGNSELLNKGGLGIVGSRNMDAEAELFTREVASACVKNYLPIISGGARGVDKTSMDTALNEGGLVVGVLAESLLKKSLEKNNRLTIANSQLLLISPFHPHAHFSVANAMGRNKFIYALSDYTLVVSAEYNKGGTWAGAHEELKRKNSLPVFVRTGEKTPLGNNKLLELGALPWPTLFKENELVNNLNILSEHRNNKQETEQGNLLNAPLLSDEIVTATVATAETAENAETVETAEISKIEISKDEKDVSEQTNKINPIYHAVLPLILQELDIPLTVGELSEKLHVNTTQLNAWLKMALDENKIDKLSKPVRYKKSKTIQVSLC